MAALALALVLGLLAAPGEDPPDRTLAVGTLAMPPFVVRAPDGRWAGPSVELWREIAAEAGLRFELREADPGDPLRGLEDGSHDIVVAPLTVTADAEARVDFTHPFFTTGLAIALTRARGAGWIDTLALVFNPPFLGLLAAFAGLQLLVGTLMWSLERRNNPHFQGPPAAGVAAGMWWAVVTMSTVGYGDKVPRSSAGRLLAMLWMLASLVALTTLTASITTSLTLGRLEQKVTGPEDLGKLRVGTVASSTSEAYLRETRMNYRSYPDADAGLSAIVHGEIDAVVYDEPALTALIKATYADDVELLPHTFQRQDYAFALPTGSPLREPINRILARRVADLQER
jgi:polar amino acid transport system substrate-binding protein